MEISLKKILITIILVLSFSGKTFSSESKVPAPFQGHDAQSKYQISYIDLDIILKTGVINTGRSTRAKAKKSTASIGTRLKTNVKRLTSLEGNRFYYEQFKEDEYIGLLSEIRESLTKIPKKVPLKNFTKEAQLAYWLNVYNVTLLDEIIHIYPRSNLEDTFEDEELLDKKLLTISGVSLSLNDIHYKILAEKYEFDPLIIYGLYQGIIGGPNIRKRAYTADNVYDALESNANEFINSNRGTYSDKNKVFRVSSLYERNKIYFPDFKQDVSAHINNYLDRDLSLIHI